MMATWKRETSEAISDVCFVETPRNAAVSCLRWNPANNNEIVVASDKSDTVYFYDLQYTVENKPSRTLSASSKGPLCFAFE